MPAHAGHRLQEGGHRYQRRPGQYAGTAGDAHGL